MRASPLAVVVVLAVLAVNSAAAAAPLVGRLGQGAVIDADSLAAVAAAALGLRVVDARSAYDVWLSGRTVVLRAGDLGVDGLGPADFAFGAYVPGRGWVLLPHTVYDDLVIVDGVAYAVLDGDRVSPDSRVVVKLPRQMPVRAPDDWKPRPPFGAGGVAREIRVEYRGATAYIYLFRDVPEPYRASAYYESVGLDRPWGLSACEPPALALRAFQAGMNLMARHLLLAYAAQPLGAEGGGVSITLGPPEPVPDGGGGGGGGGDDDGLSDYAVVIDSRPLWGGHLYGETDHVRVGVDGVNVSIPVLLDFHEDLCTCWSSARIYLWIRPTELGSSGLITVRYLNESSGEWVEVASQLVYSEDTPALMVVDITRYNYAEWWENITLEIRALGGTWSEWKVTVGPVFVKYVIYLGDWGYPLGDSYLFPWERPPWYAVNYSVDLLPPVDSWIVRIPEGESAGLVAIPFNAPAYGGVAAVYTSDGVVYAPASTFIQYSARLYLHATQPAPDYDEPIHVDFYLHGVKICEATVVPGYTTSQECNWVFLGPNATLLMSPPSYVFVVARAEESPPSDVIVTIAVELVDQNNGFVRRLLDVREPVDVATSMLPNGEPEWFLDNKFYTLAVASTVGAGSHYSFHYRLTPAFLRVDVEAMGPAVEVGCGSRTTPVGADRLNFIVKASVPRSDQVVTVEYDGVRQTMEYYTASPELFVFKLRLENAYVNPSMVEVAFNRIEGTRPSALPNIPAPASLVISLVHPEVGLALSIFDTVVWTINKINELEVRDVEIEVGEDGRSLVVRVNLPEAAEELGSYGSLSQVNAEDVVELKVLVEVIVGEEACQAGHYTALWNATMTFDAGGPLREPTAPPLTTAAGAVQRDVR